MDVTDITFAPYAGDCRKGCTGESQMLVTEVIGQMSKRMNFQKTVASLLGATP